MALFEDDDERVRRHELERRRKEVDAAYCDSLRLQSEAIALGIEIPENWWTNDDELQIAEGRGPRGEISRHVYLTTEARTRLQFLIDQATIKVETAKLELQHKRIGIYAQIAAILFGLLGALIGLIAMLKK